MRTSASDRAALDRKAIQLYSGMLLHEMGPEISGVCGLVAAPTEFRTARLMRLPFRTEYLHDGSAGLPDEAIMRHGGEAARARDSYSRLNELGKRVLHGFLRSEIQHLAGRSGITVLEVQPYLANPRVPVHTGSCPQSHACHVLIGATMTSLGPVYAARQEPRYDAHTRLGQVRQLTYSRSSRSLSSAALSRTRRPTISR